MTIDRSACLHDFIALHMYLRQTLQPVPTPTAMTDAGALAARKAAVLVPLFAGPDGTPHLLFTLRARTLANHSGEISFPGGRQDPGVPTLAATALREAYEEIGLDPARVTILGELPPVLTGVSNHLIMPFVGAVSGSLAEIAPIVNEAEVAEIIDAPLAALADPAIMHIEEWMRRGATHFIHFYQFGEYVIWGATGRMLSHLLALLPPADA